MFTFSPLIWRYSLVAEVCALNNFFLAGFFYSTVRFFDQPCPRSWYSLIFVLALGLTNHHTLGLVGFPVLAYCTLTNRKLLLQPKSLLISLGIGILAQASYLLEYQKFHEGSSSAEAIRARGRGRKLFSKCTQRRVRLPRAAL